MVLMLAMLVVWSCGHSDALTPPRIALDQTECNECGMIVSDERYACASVVRTESSRLVPLVFDDINCLIINEAASEPLEVLARWVHDKDTLEWIAAEQAFFVWAKELNTPMMSHVAAFAQAREASSFREQTGGEEMSFAEVRHQFTPERLRE